MCTFFTKQIFFEYPLKGFIGSLTNILKNIYRSNIKLISLIVSTMSFNLNMYVHILQFGKYFNLIEPKTLLSLTAHKVLKLNLIEYE